MCAGAPCGAEHRAARTDRGLALAWLEEITTPCEHELQLSPAMPMDRNARSRIDLDDTAVEIRARDLVVDDEADLRTSERIRPRAPR
jgi:hypothetical protein